MEGWIGVSEVARQEWRLYNAPHLQGASPAGWRQ